jgi:alpha-galactosidase
MEKDYSSIPHGDMPGDKIVIEEKHVAKAEVIYPELKKMIDAMEEEDPGCKIVVGVSGGSGVGKSETASLLGWFLHEDGIEAYILSGDNYPHRIPAENDAERKRIYEEYGEEALDAYLGTNQEADFRRVEEIVTNFKAGYPKLLLKRMGRTKEDIWDEEVNVADKQVLIIEWTHANSSEFEGVDIPILLNSTPEETLAHRRKRARDGEVDSPFTKKVLEIEQAHLNRDAHRAKIILTKDGRIIDYAEFCELMGFEGNA